MSSGSERSQIEHGFDWHKSPGHMAFLATFFEPRPPDKSPTDTPWPQVLGEPEEQAIERLLGDKALRECGTTQILRHELPKLSNNHLRELLRERNLTVSGKKEVLVERLTHRFDPGLLLVVSNKYLLECSDQGKELVDNYLQHGIEGMVKGASPDVVEATRKVLRWLLLEVIVASVTYDLLKEAFVRLWPDEPQPTPKIEPVPTPPKEKPKADKTPQPPEFIREPELVRIPAGYFWMGSDKNFPDARWDEIPKHNLYLPEYWICRYPVTVAQFAAFVRETGYETTAEKDSSEWTWLHPRGPNSDIHDKLKHPVTIVTWRDALAYCKWISKTSGRPYSLPSEAEWEKAARGNDGRIYPWGNHWDTWRCNSSEGGKTDTTPVDYYSPAGDSPYGCADMSANVLEWTRSLWGEKWVPPEYKYPYNPIDGREYLSASQDTRRVLRGSCFNFDRKGARCAYRYRGFPGVRRSSIGFRVVVSPGSL